MSRVLVIDDDAAVRQLVSAVLELNGHDVVAAGSADEGLALLDDSIEVVVSDLVMPGKSGLQVLEQVRARYPELGVVLMTGAGTPEQLERAAASDAVVVEKPFAHATLLAAVAQLLV